MEYIDGSTMVIHDNREPPDFEMRLLEPRPFRPFKSSEEYLYAMKEDLAEWLNGLYEGLYLDADNFLEQMETGVILCQHANNVVRKAREFYRSGGGSTGFRIPDRNVVFRRDVLPETFQSRDNVSNFISWCRHLQVHECLLFETDDLVLRKNERSFILCLLEIARRGVQFGMPAPLLVQLEQEIDAEIAKEDDGYDTMHQQQVVTNDLRSLHQRVVELLSRCTCPSQFPMIRVADGKYRIGDTKVLIFVRILRTHVMVRVGGGWDTLEHYLDKHDPCRCRAGHRLATSAKLTMMQNKSSIPSMHVTYNRPPQNNGPSSPLHPRRASASPSSTRRHFHHSPTTRPVCSDDSSNSSLQDTLDRKSLRPDISSDDDASEEDLMGPADRGRRESVTAPSSWKYSPGVPRREMPFGRPNSRLPCRSEPKQPPKIGKVSPRPHYQQSPQPTWPPEHRSQSTEDVVCANNPQTPKVGFFSRGASPTKGLNEGSFRRNDPKRHTSPRLGQTTTKMQLVPPKFGNGRVLSTPRKRMFCSPERPKAIVSPGRKSSSPELSSPVFEKLLQHSDLCSDRDFVLKIEQLIAEFQAHKSHHYHSLPPTLEQQKQKSKIPLPVWNQHSKCHS